MPYEPSPTCLDLRLRTALRRIMAGTTFLETAKFFGIPVEDINSFYRSVQRSMYKALGLKGSGFSIKKLIESTCPPEGFTRYLVRVHGKDKATRFLSSFYLLSAEKVEELVSKYRLDYTLEESLFRSYVGIKAIARIGRNKSEIYIGFGSEESPHANVFPFYCWCRDYDEYLSLTEGRYGFEVTDVLGFLSTT